MIEMIARTADEQFQSLGYVRVKRRDMIRYKNPHTGAEIFIHDGKVYKHKGGRHTHFTYREIAVVSKILDTLHE